MINRTTSTRRKDDEVYKHIEKKYKDVLNEAKRLTPDELNSCFQESDTINESCIKAYDMKHQKWIDCVDEIEIGELKEAVSKLNRSEETYRSMMLYLRKTNFSFKQRGKGAAGRGLEDIVQFALKKYGLDCDRSSKVNKIKRGERKPDLLLKAYEKDDETILVTCQNRISCKGTYRDKENDKDNEIQICFHSELPDKMVLHFAEKNKVLIVIDPDEREKTKSQIERLEVDLIAHDMDSGIIEIKSRVESGLI